LLHTQLTHFSFSSCDRHSIRRQFMNYATALALPSWTAEVQNYSQQVIRYTPIVLKAFNKAFTPVIFDLLKGVGLHLIERERLWCQWTMNVAGITHNPLQSAVRAAHTELTSAEAQATYRHIRHITREAAMDALVVGLCGVVAIATTIETVQTIYRHSVAFYGKVQARFKPAPVLIPTVEMAFAVTPDEAIAAIVEDIRVERYFTAQFDQLDTDVLAIVEEEVDEAIAQVAIAQLKSARAALALSVESDRLAREALAYVVDRAVAYAMAETVQIAEAIAINSPTTVQRMLQATAAPAMTEAELVGSLDVPGATGGKQCKPRTKAGASKVAADKPKGTRARAKAKV
jgi:hypothetical protein